MMRLSVLHAGFAALLIFVSTAIAATNMVDGPEVPGATLRRYLLEAEPKGFPQLVEGQTPNVDRRISTIDFDRGDWKQLGGATYSTLTASLHVDRATSFQLRVTSNARVRLSVSSHVVFEHRGAGKATTTTGKPIDLDARRHPFLLEHVDNGAGGRLLLEWRPGDGPWSPLSSTALTTEDDPARVTSPGPKKAVGVRRPGDRRPLDAVHPSWRVQTIRPAGFEPRVGAMAFLPDGRLIVGTFDPLQRDEVRLPDITKKEPDVLYAISGLESNDPGDWTHEVIAKGLYEPAGLCVVDGDLIVSQRARITRLSDEDGDGFFEKHVDVASGWEGWNYHQFTFGVVHRDGTLYAALSTAMAPPAWPGMGTNAAPNGPMQGSVIAVDLESQLTRVIAGGVRTPNGLGFGPDGALFYTDNQGTWMSTSVLAEIIPGRFYGHYNRTNLVPKLANRYPFGGHPSSYCDRVRTPPTAWLPQNEVVNSPTQPLLIPDGEFAGQLLLGELTAGGIRRVFLEKIGGQWQGALFRFTQGLESGVHRLAWGPDGALYLGGIGAGGNWNWRGTRFGLQRLIPTGKATFEMRAVRAVVDGFEIEFTDRVSPEWLATPENYTLTQWRYRHTEKYGGPKVDVERLEVARAVPTADGRGVRLELPGLKEGRCVHIVTDPTSTDGESIWSTEAWYTLSRLPQPTPTPATIRGTMIDATGVGVGLLPPAHAVPLLSRSPRMHFRTTADGLPGQGHRTQRDLIALPEGIAINQLTGDLVTLGHYGDFRLHAEWFAPAGGSGQGAGNSGLYLQDRYEIQVLSTAAGDRPLDATEAGAIYGLTAPTTNASTGPGTWQAFDVWFAAPRFENGAKVADARVTVYWNGVLIHDDVAVPHPTGARRDGGEDSSRPIQIAPLRLQHHANNAKGPVRYRNVWVSEWTPTRYEAGEWKDLLPAEGLGGFKIVGGKAEYRREGGDVVGTTRPNTPNTFLTTEQEYADFDLHFEVRVDPELNSGVQIRSRDIEVGLQGYQVEIDPSPRRYSAGIYDERRRGWLQSLFDAPYARRAWRYGGWNHIQVEARGPRIRTWVNGVPAADIFDAMTASGHIGLQVHGVGGRKRPLEVRWRRLRLREVER